MEIAVEEYTSPILVTVAPEAGVKAALELMERYKIRHLPVVQNEKVVGIVSERDLLTHFGKSWSDQVKVRDIMSTAILSVYMNEGLGEVALQLSAQKKGSALVLDLEGKVYGIFTTTDALNALVELFYPQARARAQLPGQ